MGPLYPAHALINSSLLRARSPLLVDQPPPSAAKPAQTEDTAYLLMRTSEPALPELFWSIQGRRGIAGQVRLRPDLEVRDGQLVPVLVDGFAVYSFPLDAHRRWRGASRVSSLRLDPLDTEGRFEIRFFNVATRTPDSETSTQFSP